MASNPFWNGSMDYCGSLLYNPIHKWGKFWAKESGMEAKMENQRMTTGEMIFTFGGTIIGGVLLSSAAYQVVYWFAKNDNDGWLMTSLQSSLLLWLGVYGVSTFVMAVYSGQSKKLVGLHLVNGFLGLLAIGLVIGFFLDRDY